MLHIKKDLTIVGTLFAICPLLCSSSTAENVIFSSLNSTIQGDTVKIVVTPGDDVIAFGVEENIPSGVDITNISNGGVFDWENGKIKWGPWFDRSGRTLSYTIIPLEGFSGETVLNGIGSFNGKNLVIKGDRNYKAGIARRYANLDSVRIEVTPLQGTSYYALEETVPSTLSVEDISENGVFNASENKIKWGPFSDDKARTFTYTLVPPSGYEGVISLNGVVSADGDERAVWGSAETVIISPISDFAYVHSDGGIMITAYQGNDSAVIIPAKIENTPVTEIGENAFVGNINLVKITVPETVTTIGNGAFAGCRKLSRINLGTSLTTLGEGVFERCKSLTEIELPDTLKSIGKFAFESCAGLQKIDLPANVTSLGEGAFLDCSALESVMMGNSITVLADNTFAGCASLKEVQLSSSIILIGESAFADCVELETIVLPSNLSTIGRSAFENCYQLTSISVPATVDAIEEYAFSNCYALQTVTLPDDILLSYQTVFNECSALNKINFISRPSIALHAANITSDETWSATECHVVLGTISIASSATLTVEEGAIIKFVAGAGLNVQKGSTLIANGTGTAPIVFTMYEDDTIGGDTNLDGSLTEPGYDLYSINGTGTITINSYTEIRYMSVKCSGTLTESQVWLGHTLYKITDNLTIPDGVTLTILPGALIKVSRGKRITVQSGGVINGTGNLAEPIIITSERDDEYGGDSNQDGDQTTPQPGDWDKIEVQDSGVMSLKYTSVFYMSSNNINGQVGGIRVTGGTVDLDSCMIAHCQYVAVGRQSGTVTMRNSAVFDCMRGYCGIIKLINCVTYDVSGVSHTGGYSGGPSFENCILSNISENWSANSYDHCLFYNPPEYNLQRASVTVLDKNGNIWGDPLFEDPENANFSIPSDSPAVDAANTPKSPATDYYGQPRYTVDNSKRLGIPDSEGNYGDIGMYEYADSAESPIDLVPLTVLGSTQAQSGDIVTVSWKIKNIGTESVAGTWRDQIYLVSNDPALGTQTVLLGECTTSANLVVDKSVSVSANFVVPAVPSGTWSYKVVANSYRDIFEGKNRTNNAALSVSLLQVVLPQLAAGQSTVSVSADDSVGFRLTETFAAGTSIIVSAPADVQIMGASGYVPNSKHYDWQGIDLKDGRFLLVIPETVTEGAYISVVNNGTSAAQVSLHVCESALEIISLSTQQIVNDASVSFTVYGIGVNKADSVILRQGSRTLSAQSLEVISETELLAHFDIPATAEGDYDVIVTAGTETAVISNGMNIIQSHLGPVFNCNIRMPSAVRAGRNYVAYFEYSNDGDVDMPAPYVAVSASNKNVLLRLDSRDNWTSETLELMALSASYPVSMLKAGESCSIPVYFRTPDTLSGSVFLNYQCTLDSDLAYPWENNLAIMRPSWANDEAWGHITANLRSQIGETWNDWLDRMRSNADYFAKMGQSGVQLSDFWQMEVNAALGSGSGVSTLASATDAYRPGRGFNLSFSRSYPAKLYQRFNDGVLGYGWINNYDCWLDFYSNSESLVIYNPGYSSRKFVKDSTSARWIAADIMDEGVITQTSKGYVLTELDGTRILFDKDLGILISMEDLDGNTVTLTWCDEGISKITHSDGQFLEFTYSGYLLSSITDDLGHTTSYAYNPDGTLASATYFTGRTTKYTYLPASALPTSRALNQIEFPDGTTRDYLYDEWGYVVASSVNGTELPVEYSRGGNGVYSVYDAAGGMSTVWCGAHGETLQVQDALGQTARLGHDSLTHQTTSVQSSGAQKAAMEYDENQNLSVSVDPMGFVTEFEYTEDFESLHSFKDARGNSVVYERDDRDRLTSILYADGTRESYTYNAKGDLESTTRQDGSSIHYEYNAIGQTTKATWSDGRVFTYTYNNLGNLTSATDSVTGTITFTYNDLEQVTSIQYPGGRGLTFEYDTVGRRTKRVSKDGHTLLYSYDVLGRLSELRNGSGELYVSYTYEAERGLPVRVDRGNGTATTCTYDILGRLTQILHLGKDGATLLSLEYTYDVNGQIAEILKNGVSTAYSYDANGQLIATSSGENYSYDPVGNRISSTDASGTSSYTTDNMNRYTTKGGMTFEYDLMGNLTKIVESAQETIYEYDIAGRLVCVTKPDGWQWSCQYDAMGNRVQVNSNGTISRFVHDPTGMINLSEEYNAAGSLLRRYIHTGTLALDETPSGERRYYHADMLGSTRLLTDNNGDVISQMDYTAFGDFVAREGEFTPFAYVGGLGVILDDTGLLYMRNRYYSPSEGRFIQSDPIGLNGGDVNFYRYCGNDPILDIDPMGTDSAEQCRRLKQQLDDLIKERKSHISKGDSFYKMGKPNYGDIEYRKANDLANKIKDLDNKIKNMNCDPPPQKVGVHNRWIKVIGVLWNT